ncbi:MULTISPECIES: hypothetical protein [Prosthecochloris]|nr:MULTISPECIES: hypothetical protein [Prosthecochloris]
MQPFLHAIDMDMVELIHVSTLKEWLDLSARASAHTFRTASLCVTV